MSTTAELIQNQKSKIKNQNDQSKSKSKFFPPSVFIIGLFVFLGYGLNEYIYLNRVPFYPPVAFKGELLVRSDGYGGGEFGAKRSGGREHNGIDLLGELGAPVCSVRSGWVKESGVHSGYGNYIIINHGRGVESLYAHLNERKTEKGERVRQGQLIGTIGKTGNAKRKAILSHLHFEWIVDGEPVDPKELIRKARTMTNDKAQMTK